MYTILADQAEVFLFCFVFSNISADILNQYQLSNRNLNKNHTILTIPCDVACDVNMPINGDFKLAVMAKSLFTICSYNKLNCTDLN